MLFFFFGWITETLLKIITLENFQTELEGNQVDYTTKPKPYNKGGKNDIRHSTNPTKRATQATT